MRTSHEIGAVERRPFRFGDRTEITELVYRAQGITTYRGRDLETGDRAIVKAASADLFGPTALARLDYEVAIINQHSEPDCRIHLGRDGGLVFCARKLLEGESLEERLRERALSPEDAIKAGVAILRALARLHPHGVLHRDIKPSNIILRERRPERATLVDFALGRYRIGDEALDEAARRAARYMAPEQAGLIAQPVDARSDLYSVGATLYEAVSGYPPFAGETLGDLLQQRATARPAPLGDTVPDLPGAFEAIVGKLLAADPRDRYQTARGALVDLERLRAAREEGVDDPDLAIGEADVRLSITEPVFIGRQAELSAGERALAQARQGRGGLVLVEGESGRGKTWFLAELGRKAGAHGARVLMGHGLDRVAQRPFQVMDEIARALVAKVHLERGWGEDIAERLGPLGGPAREALPALSAFVAEDGYELRGPEIHGETRSMAALAALLDALGSPERPALLLLDDAQWIDDSTMRLFEHWQRSAPPETGRHVVVALAYRPEEISANHPLRELIPLEHLRLAGFGDDDVRLQLSSMAGPLPAEAIDAVTRHAEGNPFLVSALLHGMVESGALRRGASGWKLNEQLAHLQTAEHAASIITARLRGLPPSTRELLSVAALLGRTFDPVLAGELAEVSARVAIRLAESLRGTLLWSDEAGTSFTFVHDRIREALLAELSERDRRALHQRAAERIASDDPGRVFELAYHYAEAGDAAEALPFALDAAEQARARFALALAERYYRIALGGVAHASVRTRLQVHRGLGDVLGLRNQHDEASRHYEEALALARTHRERAEIEQRFSFLEMKRGDMDAACRRGETALRLLGHRVPKSKALLVAWTLGEAVVQVLHTYVPEVFVRPRRRGGGEDELFAIEIYHALNGPYFFSRGVIWAGWDHLRLINLAERHPGTRAQGRAYAAHAVLFNAFPQFFERGLRISRAGADLCEQLGDLWGHAQGLTFNALMLFYLGRFDEAVAVGRKASQLFDRTGDRWEGTSGLNFAVDALVRKGDLRAAVAQAQEIWERGLAIGDSHAMAWSLDAWSRATDGRIPGELVSLARERARDLQTSVAVDQADGVRLIHEGCLDEAVEVLERARGQVDREGFFFELNAPVLTYLATALRKRAEAASPYDPRSRKRRLARAEKAARRAVKVARTFQFNLPHALREYALVAAMQGAPSRARRRIDESVEVAAKLDLRYELARSRLARAELGAALGWQLPSGELEAAQQEVEALRAAAIIPEPAEEATPAGQITLSLIDRFDALLEIGRGIATALTRDEVYAQAHRAALRLLRGQRCVVLARAPANGSGQLTPVYGDVGLPYSRELVERAWAAGRSVTPSGDETLRDIAAHRAASRSILCIPIWVRGAPQACLYLTHADLSELFRDDERRIGDFLATLTGAALENAEGFRQLQQFSDELERRVQARTQELAHANRELEDSLRTVQETQDQLLQASKMAALGTLIAGLSHELNNPLGVVLGNVQVLLKTTPEDGPVRGPLLAIERQALRSTRLIRALLDFSRARERERHRTRPEVLIEAVAEFIEAEAKAQGTIVRQKLPDEPLPDIMVSPQEIESALLNLLSNAIDVTPSGGAVTLEARVETRDEVEGVAFRVADEGPGIPADLRSRIFDPFFTTKPVGQGTGLGLSITNKIVRSHGGALEVDSVEGKGATFTVWLPVYGAELSASG